MKILKIYEDEGNTMLSTAEAVVDVMIATDCMSGIAPTFEVVDADRELNDNDREILLKALSLLVDSEGDTIDRTELYDKLR